MSIKKINSTFSKKIYYESRLSIRTIIIYYYNKYYTVCTCTYGSVSAYVPASIVSSIPFEQRAAGFKGKSLGRPSERLNLFRPLKTGNRLWFDIFSLLYARTYFDDFDARLKRHFVCKYFTILSVGVCTQCIKIYYYDLWYYIYCIIWWTVLDDTWKIWKLILVQVTMGNLSFFYVGT